MAASVVGDENLSKRRSWGWDAPDEIVNDAVKDLLSWGCCPRCVLRFLGEKHANVYSTTPDILYKKLIQTSTDASKNGANGHESKKEESDGTANTDTKVNAAGDSGDSPVYDEKAVCVTCLGLLQSTYCNTDFTNKVVGQVLSENFEFDSFTCAITIPVSILLREHAIWVLLREKYPKLYFGLDKVSSILFIKDIWKMMNARHLSQKLSVKDEKDSKFIIRLQFEHEKSDQECNFLISKFPSMFRNKKSESRKHWKQDFKPNSNAEKTETFSRKLVEKALEKMSEQEFQRCYTCPPASLATPLIYPNVSCTMFALYMAGRYNKYCRELSQTPWLLDGERKTESSVQELLCELLKEKVNCSEYRFSSAGREDVDVRCLGEGRPFLIEFIDPHISKFTQEQLSNIQKEVNTATDRVALRDLQIVEKEETEQLKEGEVDKIKSYSAICWSPQTLTQDSFTALPDVKDLVLAQKTPVRVLHRRPLHSRDKLIHSVSASLVDEHHFKLSVRTQAGTYIKEFVHGDFGRTTPNLGTILNVECDILELDVESVELDWPPRLER